MYSLGDTASVSALVQAMTQLDEVYGMWVWEHGAGYYLCRQGTGWPLLLSADSKTQAGSGLWLPGLQAEERNKLTPASSTSALYVCSQPWLDARNVLLCTVSDSLTEFNPSSSVLNEGSLCTHVACHNYVVQSGPCAWKEHATSSRQWLSQQGGKTFFSLICGWLSSGKTASGDIHWSPACSFRGCIGSVPCTYATVHASSVLCSVTRVHPLLVRTIALKYIVLHIHLDQFEILRTFELLSFILRSATELEDRHMS